MDSPTDPDGALDAAGQGGTPRLTLDRFTGPLDTLLALARARTIDLSAISLAALLDQLAVALQQASVKIPLGQKADWVVMAAWLLQLRSRLLLPADAPAQLEAAAEASELQRQLATLQESQALGGWLDRRPQLTQEVFARGRPEVFGVSVDAGAALDVVEFLWASLALFEDAEPDTATVYRPVRFDLHTVVDARERILRRLDDLPKGGTLEGFLPDPDPSSGDALPSALRRRSAWSSTFVASLELARLGEVMLGQGEDFQPIHVARFGH